MWTGKIIGQSTSSLRSCQGTVCAVIKDLDCLGPDLGAWSDMAWCDHLGLSWPGGRLQASLPLSWIAASRQISELMRAHVICQQSMARFVHLLGPRRDKACMHIA